MYSECFVVTTSVIYGSSTRGQNVQYGNQSPVVTAATIYANLTSFLTTKVTRTRSTNTTGSTANPSATFSATPASGSALLCVLLRSADNATSTMPAGWTLLTGGGTGASRRAECWFKRAGGSEPTVVTMTNATAAAWNMTIIEYSGWATLADPVVLLAAASVASTTTVVLPSTGMQAGVAALVSQTAWTTATLADSLGTNASRTQLATTTQANVSEIVGYNNMEDAACTYTISPSRGVARLVVGWPHNTNSDVSGGAWAGITTTASQNAGQIGIEFNTATIPAANTVSAATVTIKTGNIIGVWPSTATAEMYSINSTAIAKNASDTRTVWRTPTEITALTKVATRAAGSTTTNDVLYAWTSDAAFISNINQGSTTRLLLGTSEQRTGSLSGTDQRYNISTNVGDHFITIVHDRLVTIPTATATATASEPSRIVAYLLTLPTVTATATGAISTLVTFLRTISAAAQAIPAVIADYLPFATQLPRVVRLPFRAIVSLSQQTRARISQRSTLRLPKE